jgi:acylphosphatase
MARIALRLIIKGKVQGVGYRWQLSEMARKHHVSGWVLNHSNGDVEAFVQGVTEDVEEVVRWCWRGVPAAKVNIVSARDADYDRSLDGFKIKGN